MKIHIPILLFTLAILVFVQGCNVPPTVTVAPAPTALPTATSLQPLAAELVANSPQAFSPTAPIVIHFSQPMDASNATPAAFLFPSVPAEIRWNADFTELTLIPYDALQPLQTYRVFIHQNLRSATGATFEQQPEWVLTTAQAVRVFISRQVTANQDSKVDPLLQPTFALHFSAPMDAASVQTALHLQPPVGYRLEWNETNLLVHVQESLPLNTTLYLILDETARALNGTTLSESAQYQFHVPSAVSQVSCSNQKNVTISFSYPIDSESFRNTVQVTNSNGQRIDGALTWSNPQSVWFIPKEPLRYSTIYTVTFTAPLKHKNGTFLDVPSPERFITPPPLTTFHANANKTLNISTEEPLVISFLTPTDHASVEKALRFTPPITGTVTWETENTIEKLIFTPAQPLPPYHNYRLTIETTARSADNQPLLLEPISFAIRSQYDSSQETDFSFGDYGANLQVLDVNGRRAVRFWRFGATRTFVFKLYRLSLEQFIPAYLKNFREGYNLSQFTPHLPITGAALQAQWQQTFIENTDAIETLIPSDVPAGLYILQIHDEQDRTGELFVVLTRNTLLLSESKHQFNVWVSDINGKSVPNTLIQLYDQNGQKIGEGHADANGVFSIPQTVQSPQPALAIALSSRTINGTDYTETDITLSGVSWIWRADDGGWLPWYTAPATPLQFIAGNLYTDRPIYQPSQRVYFKTIVRADDDAILSLLPPGTPVRLQVNDSRDNPVSVITATLNEYGTAAAFVDIAEGATLGVWHIHAQIGNDRITQSFQVEEYTKPQFSLQISHTQSTLIADQPITLDIAAQYYFGQPVANAKLDAALYYNSWDHTIDSFGDYTTRLHWYPSEYTNFKLGKTTADGTLQPTIVIPDSIFSHKWWRDNTNGWLQIGVEVRAQDADGETIHTMLPLKVWQHAEQIELRAPSIAAHGQPSPFRRTCKT